MTYELRIWVAMRVTRDLDACHALLAGEPVDESRLDPRGLAWALQMRFVRMDLTAVGLFADQLRAVEDGGGVT